MSDLAKGIVSVVVPIFNLERYIGFCIESLLRQSLKSIEILCINDGSTDRSSEIVKEYSNLDSRVILIDQENKGAAAARNKGILAARGEYIMFVDGDDWVEANAVEEVVAFTKKTNAEIVCFGASKCTEGQEEERESEYIKYSENIAGDIRKIRLFELNVVPWGKLYKRSFLIENDLMFPEGLFFEDNAFFWNCMSCVKRIAVMEGGVYHYRIRKNSLMRSRGMKVENRGFHYLYGLDEILKKWRSNGFILNNKSLFQWIFEDYVRLGYECIDDKKIDLYRSEVEKRINAWEGIVRCRWGTLPSDLVNRRKISFFKYRKFRSIYKRQLVLESFGMMLKEKFFAR